MHFPAATAAGHELLDDSQVSRREGHPRSDEATAMRRIHVFVSDDKLGAVQIDC